MSIKDRLGEIPAGTELLRRIRTLSDDELAELTVDDLTHAARWLRAAAYSANEGARRLDRARQSRTEDPCSPPLSPSTPPERSRPEPPHTSSSTTNADT